MGSGRRGDGACLLRRRGRRAPGGRAGRAAELVRVVRSCTCGPAGSRRRARCGWRWPTTAASSVTTGSTLPDLENRDKAYSGPVVHPAYRRRGARARDAAARGNPGGGTRADDVLRRGGVRGRPATHSPRQSGRSWSWKRCAGSSTCAISPRAPSPPCGRTAEQAAAGYSLVSWDGPGARPVLRGDGRGVQRVRRRAARREPGTRAVGRGAGADPDRHLPAGRGDARPQRGRGARRRRRDGRLQRGHHRPGASRLGLPAAHRGHPAAPRAPAGTAGEDRDAGAAGRRRAGTGADPDRQRGRQPAHDRGQRAARLPGVQARLAVLRDARSAPCASRRSRGGAGTSGCAASPWRSARAGPGRPGCRAAPRSAAWPGCRLPSAGRPGCR